MVTRLRWVRALLVFALFGGCAQFQLRWVRQNEPIAEKQTHDLSANGANLQACMDRLGAPDRVWESSQGIVLSYGWLDRVFWQFEVVIYGTNTSIDGRTVFSYNSTSDGFRGAVLVFDDDLKLKFVRFGMLGDITRDLPRRPTLID